MKNIDMYVENFKARHEMFINACDSMEVLGLWDKEKLGEMDTFYSTDLASIIIRIIASDGKITDKEVKYLNKTFDFKYTLHELIEVYNSCKDDIGHSFDESFENGITHMRKINEKLADEYKELLFLVCDIIIESDGIISEAEIEEVKRLKEICK